MKVTEKELMNALIDLRNKIEATSCNYSEKDKAYLIDKIRVESKSYRIINQYIEEN